MPDSSGCEVRESLSLLIVEDDKYFRERLAQSLVEFGYSVSLASSLSETRDLLRISSYRAALIDFKLADGSGLTLIPELLVNNSAMRVIVMSGYATLSSAVAATRDGAVDYLVKPVDVDEIDAMLRGKNRTAILGAHASRDPNTVRWDHIEATLRMAGGNVSKAARDLGLHRRTLQRILSAERGKPKEY